MRPLTLTSLFIHFTANWGPEGLNDLSKCTQAAYGIASREWLPVNSLDYVLCTLSMPPCCYAPSICTSLHTYLESHNVKATYCQHDLYLLILTMITLLKLCLLDFPPVKSPFFTFCHTVHFGKKSLNTVHT